MTGSSARIAICAKSTWHPALRREHALTTAAGALGIEVEFVEQPSDMRRLRSDRSWMFSAPDPVGGASPMPGVRVTSRRTLAPGHRNRLAHSIDSAGLRRTLAVRVRDHGEFDAVVVNTPWDWAGVRDLSSGTRRIFDLADDWRTMLPRRRHQVEEWYRRIDDEADEILVVSPALQELFARQVTVVPNAAAPTLHASAPVPAPGMRRMVYVGTLSERFDTDLIAAALRRLPDWELDLYGQVLYRSGGGSALERLVEDSGGRVRRHGVITREGLAAVIDAADVAIVPNVRAISAGQDSMKLYDYAARARPIVASGLPASPDSPPLFKRAHDVVSFAAAVRELAGLDAYANRAWSEKHTWDVRATAWLSSVLGHELPTFGPQSGGVPCTS